MASTTVNNFPDELYAQLSRRAADNHREVADELVVLAKETLSDDWGKMSLEQKLDVIDKVRGNSPNAWVTAEMIRTARDEGRP